MLPVNVARMPVYLATGATDMRKSINGLAAEVYEYFEADLFSGSIFAFCNRRKKLVKLLYWDGTGFCLWMKRLDKSRFPWPDEGEDVLKISGQELSWLLSGLRMSKYSGHREATYRYMS